MKKILLVEDNEAIQKGLKYSLEQEKFVVELASDVKTAKDKLAKSEFNLIILDVMLPDVDGFFICRKIREKHNYPIIMLTAKGEEIDKVTGLTIGADAYLTKPFRPLEVIANVKAQLRRATKYNNLEEKEEDKSIILWILCEKRGEVISAERLFELVWGEKYYTNSTNTIMVHIRHLREKMKDSAENPKYIKTVWGVGYKIE